MKPAPTEASDTVKRQPYRERYLTLFQASLKSSIALLKETFADSAKVIAQIEQPPSPKLSQLILQPPSQTLIDFIQKPLSEDVITKIAQDSINHPSLTNPQLNLRGYEGAIASFQTPLDNVIRRDTHPEGWGFYITKLAECIISKGEKLLTRIPCGARQKLATKPPCKP
ncbi:hypothetical protein [Coleofasciculus sp.]|uniref:hypothetical protein n=1 Tax=Coleofasciculus sp. TaxID=3100458 RepID=UPI003A33D284